MAYAPPNIPGKMFVGKLHPEADNDDLKQAFSQFGTVESAGVARDKVTKGSRKFGFVTFADYHSIDKALAAGKVFVRGQAVDYRRNLPRDPQTNELIPQVDKVFVGRVSDTATETNFREYFSKYGTVKKVAIFAERGFAFVTFDAVDCVNYMMAHHEPFHIINGRKCEVKRAEDRSAVGQQPPADAHNTYHGHSQPPGFRPPAPMMGAPGHRPPFAAPGQRPPLFGGMPPPRGRAPPPEHTGRPPMRPPLAGHPPRGPRPGLMGTRPPLRDERAPPSTSDDRDRDRDRDRGDRGLLSHRNALRDRPMDGGPPVRPPGGPLRGAPGPLGPHNPPLRNTPYGRPGDRDDRRPPAHRDSRDGDHRDPRDTRDTRDTRDGPHRRDSERRGAPGPLIRDDRDHRPPPPQHPAMGRGPPNAPPRAPAPANRAEPLIHPSRRPPLAGPGGHNGPAALLPHDGVRPTGAYERRDSQAQYDSSHDNRMNSARDGHRDTAYPPRDPYNKPDTNPPYGKQEPPASGAHARPSLLGPSGRGSAPIDRRNDQYNRPPATAPAQKGPPDSQYKAHPQATTGYGEHNQNKPPAQAQTYNKPADQVPPEANTRYDGYGQQGYGQGQTGYNSNAQHTAAAPNSGGYQAPQANANTNTNTNTNGYAAYGKSNYTQPQNATTDNSGYYNNADGQYNQNSNAYAQAPAQSTTLPAANTYGQPPNQSTAPPAATKPPTVPAAQAQEYTQDYTTYGYQQPAPQQTGQNNAPPYQQQQQWSQPPETNTQTPQAAGAPQAQGYDQGYGQQAPAQSTHQGNTQAPYTQQQPPPQHQQQQPTQTQQQGYGQQGYGQQYAYGSETAQAYVNPAQQGYGQTQPPTQQAPTQTPAQAPVQAPTPAASYTQQSQQPVANAYNQQAYTQQGYAQQSQQGYTQPAAAANSAYYQPPVASKPPTAQAGGYGARTPAAPAQQQAAANQNAYGAYQQQNQGYGAQSQGRW